MEHVRNLENWQPRAGFFIGFDSDGCVFDNMEIKHRECFCPAFIQHYRLQGVARAARETLEFVNLYSRTRGINRFSGVLKSLDLLQERSEPEARGVEIPAAEGLRSWLSSGACIAEAALEDHVRRHPLPDLVQALEWSRDASEAVWKISRNIPPFPQVPRVLERVRGLADVVVTSSAPVADLEREWKEYGIRSGVRVIAGQEWGNKRSHLEKMAAGRYHDGCMLMVGDSPGDYDAAVSHGLLFYPILPGREEFSWDRFLDEALARFFDGTFSGDYQAMLLAEFDAALPVLPPWV